MLAEVDNLMDTFHQELLPLLSINRNIRKGWQTLHSGFLGVDLLNFTVEMLIEKLNLLLQHYGSSSDTGITLQANIEHLQLESGYTSCPFLQPFQPMGQVVTHSWEDWAGDCSGRISPELATHCRLTQGRGYTNPPTILLVRGSLPDHAETTYYCCRGIGTHLWLSSLLSEKTTTLRKDSMDQLPWTACLVERLTNSTVGVLGAQQDPFREAAQPASSTWHDRLLGYGPTSMWDNLKTVGSKELIFKAIWDGSALWDCGSWTAHTTDGLHHRLEA
eukprot:CCRYP_009243-RA/>CCRYP_009243-RA protein AED:0.57 eAED:0.57 QI:0/0/0/0.5/1/1/2/0/274